MVNPVTKQWIFFLPYMPHLTKNILTSLELSSSLNLKQDLRYGNAPMQMIKEIWLNCDGVSDQLQITKLTAQHFEENTYSQMSVSLAAQLLLQSMLGTMGNSVCNRQTNCSIQNIEASSASISK
jgi:hypothetical protein